MVTKRHYEQLQSRWRQEVLRLPAGPPTHPTSRLPTVEYCLPREFHGSTPVEGGWNFVSGAAHDYALGRSAGFNVFDDRLWRNMLSSQPLAFNIAGGLREHLASAADAFAELTEWPVIGFDRLGESVTDRHALDGLHAEWAPPRSRHTGDGSSFDIAAPLRLGGHRRVFLSIEVKYTDDFSSGVAARDLATKLEQYRPHLDALGIGDARREPLLRGRTFQFLRSVMLTDSVVRRGLRGDDRLDGGLATVVAPAADAVAREAVATVSAALGTTRTQVAFWSLDDLLDGCADQAPLQVWADTMRRRYLTGPVVVENSRSGA
ncbi:PGN_0703 family putative restriction endonuclease [Actinomycetospora aeridis]|uniref:PD-(D/E)XK nuclease-like domain-containing protein n=1 Tax=Actinomycetospora aeridis TaxID=3129231 RepID=A0ABU8NBF6_9PSEU